LEIQKAVRMCADSKTVEFLKIGSLVQQLLNVVKCHLRHFLHCFNGSICANGIFQHSITFELLNKISYTRLFWNLRTVGQHFQICINFVEFKSFLTPFLNKGPTTIFKCSFTSRTNKKK